MKNKNIFYVIIILVVVIAVCIVAVVKNNRSQSNTQKANTKNITKNIEDNEQTTKNETENEEFVPQNREIETNIIDTSIQTETPIETSETDEEKVIQIVKDDWGTEAGLGFSVEGKNEDGNYIVAVRNTDTTALAYYTVNSKTGEFTKKEIN